MVLVTDLKTAGSFMSFQMPSTAPSCRSPAPTAPTSPWPAAWCSRGRRSRRATPRPRMGPPSPVATQTSLSVPLSCTAYPGSAFDPGVQHPHGLEPLVQVLRQPRGVGGTWPGQRRSSGSRPCSRCPSTGRRRGCCTAGSRWPPAQHQEATPEDRQSLPARAPREGFAHCNCCGRRAAHGGLRAWRSPRDAAGAPA